MTATGHGTRTASVDWLDRSVLVYLALPNLIFLAGWLKPEFGWPAAALLAAMLVMMLRHGVRSTALQSKSILLLVLVLAAIWIFFSGIGHFVYANATDWVVRDSVLVDLVRRPWPVTYAASADGHVQMMRAPIAYFLPAAVVAWMFGMSTAEWALAIWSYLGVFLTLLLLIHSVKSPRVAAIRLLVFILFSGMDIAGLFSRGLVADIGAHLEWWSGRFQYSSNTTLLFWVPNHAIGAWLATAWLIRAMETRVNPGMAIAMVAMTPLWSPLSAVGLVPFFAAALLIGGRRDPWTQYLREFVDAKAIVVVVILGALLYPYLLIQSGNVPSSWSSEGISTGNFFDIYIRFVLVEFLVLNVLLLLRAPRDLMLWICAICLLLFPLYRLGPGSDFTMRASIPALAILAIRLGEWLSTQWAPGESVETHGEDWKVSVAMLVFAIGLATPFQEFARTLIEPRWALDESRSLMDTAHGAPHYIADRDGAWATRFLRTAQDAK